MCRLFGANAGDRAVHLSYWLLEAPDSLIAESERNPDGAGIGWFSDAGAPHLRKWGSAAFDTTQFSQTALELDATTCVTHVRAATTGRDDEKNSHPFLIESRLMAHNGGFGDIPKLEAKLGDYVRYVQGDTDSERYAALIAQETDSHGGDVGAGITHAAQWIAAELPMYSLNCIVATSGNLWALRYPDTRALHAVRRSVADAEWRGQSSTAGHVLTSCDGEAADLVLVASERIDDADDWRMLDPGELIHVDSRLQITSTVAVDGSPANFHLPPGVDHNYDLF
ncbi:MAG: class II glutamine amidotransferase [Candidatus Nanopelagicales bacterium]